MRPTCAGEKAVIKHRMLLLLPLVTEQLLLSHVSELAVGTFRHAELMANVCDVPASSSIAKRAAEERARAMLLTGRDVQTFSAHGQLKDAFGSANDCSYFEKTDGV